VHFVGLYCIIILQCMVQKHRNSWVEKEGTSKEKRTNGSPNLNISCLVVTRCLGLTDLTLPMLHEFTEIPKPF
jgi:hypothetical protein